MSDHKSEHLLAMKLNTRETAWLWHALSLEGIRFEECQLDTQRMRLQFTEHLTPVVIKTLEHARDTQFLSDDDFRWIDKEGRQPTWLVRKAMKVTGRLRLPPAFETLPMRQQVIAVIDTWETRLSNKKETLKNLKHEWRRHLQHDKLFSWFKGNDEHSKCTMGWEWLQKHHPQLTRHASPAGSHAELLDLFDQRDITPGEKELFVTKIKRRWSTQKTRENSPHKKQYNFVLSQSVNNTLDRLAKEHKLSRTKVIEKLLLTEAELGLYLPPQKPQN